MKIGGNPETWRTRLAELVKPTGEVGVDAARLAASEDVYARATASISEGRATESFMGAARRLWGRRGEDGIPELAPRIVAEGVAEHRDRLLSATRDELTALVDRLALDCLGSEQGEAALDRLLDLKVILRAGGRVGAEYAKSLRSTPRPRRTGAPLDPKWTETMRVLEARLDEVCKVDRVAQYAQKLGRASNRIAQWADRQDLAGLQDKAGSAAASAWDAGGAAIEAVSSKFGDRDIEVPGWIKRVATGTKQLFSQAVPKPAREALEALTTGAHGLVSSLYGVGKDADQPDKLVDRYVDALQSVLPVVDPSADAVGVGVLKEAAAVVNAGRGHELVYNRATRQLQLNELTMVGARLGIGGTVRAYCRNVYGDGAAIAAARGRSGLEVGALIGHAGFYRADVPEGHEAPRGFLTTVSLGYNFSLPILSDQSLFSVHEKPATTIALSEAQVDRIEAALAQIPKASANWTGSIGDAVRRAD